MLLPPDDLGQEFSSLENGTYYNTAYMGPLPESSRRAAERALQEECSPGSLAQSDWPHRSELVRQQFAELIEVPTHQVAHSTSVAEIVGHLAHGLRLNPTDVVVSAEGEYPSNVLPWMMGQKQRGYDFQLLSEECFYDFDLLARKLPPGTRVVNLSHVRFDNGRRIDLLAMGRFLREREILFVVDMAQSLGSYRLKKEEVELIDVLVCPSYKWLLGLFGHAFGYFSVQALKNIQPTQLHWSTSANGGDVAHLTNYTYESREGAIAFDRGQTASGPLLAALLQSMKLLGATGLDRIYRHNRSLAEHFMENLDRSRFELATPERESASIVAFSSRNEDNEQVLRALKEKGIDLSWREGRLRASFHFFNRLNQVENFLDELQKISMK